MSQLQLPPLDPARAGEDKGSATIAAITTISSISTLFAVARLWVRIKIKRQFQFGDFMIVTAVICGWLSVGFSAAAVHSGSGRHIQTLTTEQIQGAIFFTLVGFVPGIFSIVIPKLAVVHLLSRLLEPSRPHLIWLWSITVFLLLCCVVTVGLVFGQCQPANSQWDFSVPKRYCWDTIITVDFFRAACVVSAFVDLYLSIYPGIVLYKIRLPTKKKIALSAALGVGSLSVVVGIYRVSILDKFASVDSTYENIDLAIWTIVEGSVIIIAACIPLLQPLLETIRNRPWTTEDTSRRTYPTPDGRQGYANLRLSDSKSRIRKLRRKFEMDSILTTKNMDEEVGGVRIAVGGQHRILEEDETGLVTTEAGPQNDSNSIPLKQYQEIYRTDELEIRYARDEESGAKPHGY